MGGHAVVQDIYVDHEEQGWCETVGVIKTEEQRHRFDEILFTQFGIMLTDRALTYESEMSDIEDVPDPGDDGAAA
jgi:hypothetical protein